MKKYFRSLFSAFLPSQINQFHKEVNSYINYQEKGAKLYRAGQYYLALKAYETAILIAPSVPDAVVKGLLYLL